MAGGAESRSSSGKAQAMGGGGKTASLDGVRSEIDHMRVQLGKQRKEILQLQRAGIPTASAELLLTRMLAKIEGLCAERDRLKKEQGGPTKGHVLGGRSW